MLITISILSGACSKRKIDIDNKNLIPEKELIPLLTDIHLTDGLLTIPQINIWTSSLDSITTYIQVIEKHGYTKEIMDKTMQYYFVNDPKELNRIYDQVLGILSEMESRVDKEANAEMAQNNNQWTGKDFYSFPDPSGNDSSQFDITLSRPGVYTLGFSAILYPDDQSVNPGPTIYSCSPDSIETGKKRYFKTANFLKDGQLHLYRFNIQVPAGKIIHLRGWLFDPENGIFGTEKHVIIDNISFSYSEVLVS